MNRNLYWSTAVASLFFFAHATAQSYPTKSVRFVLPFPPGGGTDTLARIVGLRQFVASVG